MLAVGKDSGVAGGEGAIYFWAKLPQGTYSSPPPLWPPPPPLPAINDWQLRVSTWPYLDIGDGNQLPAAVCFVAFTKWVT